MRKSVFAVLILALVVSPAAAAAPINDDRENATEIVAPFPYVDSGDLATATRSQFERDLCGDQIASGVWYKFSPSVDTVLSLSVTPETNPVIGWYSEDVTGSEGGCSGPGAWDYRLVAGGGKTLYILLGTTGYPYWTAYTLSVDATSLNHIGVSLAASAKLMRDRGVTVTGTLACESDVSVEGEIVVTQKSGHGYITGSTGPIALYCSAPTTIFIATAYPTVTGSRFVAGPANVSAQFQCSPEWWNCSTAAAESKIRIRSG